MDKIIQVFNSIDIPEFDENNNCFMESEETLWL